MDAHSTLTVSERAALARMGCTVCIESGGVATCRLSDGRRVQYAVEHLRYIVREGEV